MSEPSVLNRIAHFLTKNGNGASIAKKEAGAPSATIPIAVAQFWDMVPPATTDQSNLTPRLAYKRDNLVFACMDFRAVKVSEPDLWITQEVDGQEEWIADMHPLEALLEEPNPDMSMSELIAILSKLEDIDGEWLLVKDRERSKQVARLWPYNKDLYTVEPANGRLYGRFRVKSGTGYEMLTPDDVIYHRKANPSALGESVSRVRTALSKINLSQDLVETIRVILRKGVQPGGVFSFKNGLDEVQRIQTQQAIRENYAGVHNAGKAMILDGEVTFQAIVASLKDMTTGPAQYDCEAAICQAFQIHPILVGAKVGIESNSGLSDSIEPALKLFYDIAARPMWRQMERAFTKGLLREVDTNVRRFIRFDTSKVQALQEGMLERVQTAMGAREFWTVDECRVYTDMDPLDDERGEMLVAEAVRPVIDPNAFGGFGGEPEPEDDEQKARKRTRSSTDAASRHILYLSRRAVQEAHEFTLEMAARTALLRDMEEVLSIVRGSAKSDPIGPLPDPDAIIAKVDKYLKGTAQERWDERMRGPLTALGRHSVQQMAAELGVSFDVLQPGLLDYIEREVGFLIKHVTDTTKDIVRRELRAGIAAGEGIEQLSQRLQSAAGFGEERARLIARTESTRATNGSQRESLSDYAKTSGNKATKIWLASPLDENSRDEHQSQNGEKRDIDAVFTSGEQHPSKPNCGCTLLYELEEAA